MRRGHALRTCIPILYTHIDVYELSYVPSDTDHWNLLGDDVRLIAINALNKALGIQRDKPVVIVSVRIGSNSTRDSIPVHLSVRACRLAQACHARV